MFLVLGSGATKGSEAKVRHDKSQFEPPLDHNFWDQPIVHTIFTSGRFPALSYYRSRILSPSLESTWAEVDALLKLCIARPPSPYVLSEAKALHTLESAIRAKADSDDSYRQKLRTDGIESRLPSIALWELLDLVRTVFGEIDVDNANSPLCSLINCLRNEGLFSGILTFNWDTLVERLYPELFHYPDLYAHEGSSLPLFKLHGSLNWQFSQYDVPRREGSPRHPEPARMIHPTPDSYEQPDIIGATFFKQEITLDFQLDERARFFRTLWGRAAKELSEATGIVFVGFSFPRTDFHAKALFKSLVRSAEHKHSLRIAYCHLGDSDVLETTMQEIFPKSMARHSQFRGGLKELDRRKDELVAFLRTS